MPDDDKLKQFPHDRAPAHRNGGGGGSGPLLEHRLSELERRMASLELTAKSINDTVIEINTTLGSVATKTYVLTIFGVTGGLAVLTFIGHIVLRAVGN